MIDVPYMIFNNRGPNCAERVVIDATSFLRVHVTNMTNRGSQTDYYVPFGCVQGIKGLSPKMPSIDSSAMMYIEHAGKRTTQLT